MRHARVEAREHRAGGERHVRDLIILAHERVHGVQAVKPHDGDELDLVAGVAAQEVDMAEACNLARFDPRDHLAAHNRFIARRVRWRCPAAPDAADHPASLCLSSGASS
jgi:hypothetical protein